MKLIVRLLIGMIGGIFVGVVAPDWMNRAMITFKMIFGELLNFAIPLVIIFFIVSGIAKLGKESGKLLGLTSGFAYSSSVLAGTLAFVVAILFIPLWVGGSAGEINEGTALEPFFELEIEPVAGVMTALVAAFVFGIGITRTQSDTLRRFFDEGKEIIEKLIWNIIIPVLPFYIAGIFVEITAEGTIFETLQAFGIVLALAVLTHLVWLIIMYTTAGMATGRNPFTALKNMLPAYFTGLGTMSSAATIPVTVRQTKKNNVRPGTADSTVPLCATIHLSGSTITIVLCAMAVMIISSGLALPSFPMMLPFILSLGLIMVAAPGVPGGAVFAALGLLGTMLGFNESALGLMIALYMAQDSFGTACNVTGDGAIALMVDQYAGADGSPDGHDTDEDNGQTPG